jgi:hypothetical protein
MRVPWVARTYYVTPAVVDIPFCTKLCKSADDIALLAADRP